MVFKRCFENDVEEQMVSHISSDGNYRLWLQRPLNLFIKDQRANYIVAIFLRILEIFSV